MKRHALSTSGRGKRLASGWCKPADRLVLLLALAWAAGCGGSVDQPPKPAHVKSGTPATPSLAERIERSLNKAAEFLVLRQDKDGAWRSDVYGQFKDGPTLTPLVAEALQHLPATGEASLAARKKAAEYLAGMARADGSIEPGPGGWPHPVYTAALTVALLSHDEHRQHIKARDAWLAFLRSHQFTEALGWRASDAFYGGWGYSDSPPRKPEAEQELNPLAEPNISATVYALDALRAAGVPASDPAVQKALAFVVRCQNFDAKEKRNDSPFNDGGFFFLLNDADRNKAGELAGGKEEKSQPLRTGRRFKSYGSTTADGLRCLVACGLPQEHPRVAAARQWLISHFSATQHPGDFGEDKQQARDALYYYYCNSAARALAACGVKEAGAASQRMRWAEVLAEELMRRQQENGSWQNPVGEIREDDPLVATAFAIGALCRCHAALR